MILSSLYVKVIYSFGISSNVAVGKVPLIKERDLG